MQNEFPVPNVVVSKCLTFEKCRYNGDVINDPVVEQMKPYVNFIPVCPEVEIGLGIPRDPIRIIKEKKQEIPRLYQPATGEEYTQKMNEFVNEYLDSLKDIDGFILKHRSPSCGINNVKIYPGFKDKENPFPGPGMFGGEVKERFSGLAVEDEGRLKNYGLREYYYIKLFTLASFRNIRQEATINKLVKFQARNKLLFMAFNQNKMRELGNITANHEKLPNKQVFEKYQQGLYKLLSESPQFTSWINVLMHAFGGISKKLTAKERQFFLNKIEEYRDERIPLSVLIGLIQSWALRFNDEYLLAQTFMNPFPEGLVEITDSGKGRDR